MINAETITVTMRDAREFWHPDGCVPGWKDFVEGQGFNFREVVLRGLTAKQLIDTGDQMAIDLANYVIQRELDNG